MAAWNISIIYHFFKKPSMPIKSHFKIRTALFTAARRMGEAHVIISICHGIIILLKAQPLYIWSHTAWHNAKISPPFNHQRGHAVLLLQHDISRFDDCFNFLFYLSATEHSMRFRQDTDMSPRITINALPTRYYNILIEPGPRANAESWRTGAFAVHTDITVISCHSCQLHYSIPCILTQH